MIENQEAEKLCRSAELIAQCLFDDHVLHVFGSGHSHVLAEEISRRAGGLVCVNPILDTNYTLLAGAPSKSRIFERLEGYSEAVLDSYILYPGEVIIIVSSSGINPSSVGAALYSKKKGLKVISITSIEHSSSLPSRHSSGLKLYQVSDIYIDTHVPIGDAIIEIAPNIPKVCPISTIIGASILQALIGQVVQAMLIIGNPNMHIWESANTINGDSKNREKYLKYPNRYKP